MRVIGLLLLVSLGACSGKGAGGNSAAVDTASTNTQVGAISTASQNLPAGFRDKIVAQCVSQAQRATPLKVDFTPICGCSTDKLLASHSPTDLMKGVAPAEAQAVAAACAKEHPITLPKS